MTMLRLAISALVLSGLVLGACGGAGSGGYGATPAPAGGTQQPAPSSAPPYSEPGY
ncbi:MAG TPA: hypothetical protein VGR87_10550 [Candidatus Limnocylindria bacterium]|nr:hypothetical protein [Candidatus Limnocylindria bacterium]